MTAEQSRFYKALMALDLQMEAALYMMACLNIEPPVWDKAKEHRAMEAEENMVGETKEQHGRITRNV